MDEKTRIAKTYTHARHAEWAGDITQCEAYLRRVEPAFAEGLPVSAGLAEVIRGRAGELLRRMAYLPEAARPPAEAIVETAHFRGVIRQLGTREFELRAYLSDFGYEETFWGRVEILVAERRKGDARLSSLAHSRPAGEATDVGPGAGTARADGDWPDEEDDDPSRGWWEASGSVSIQVTVSEFALVGIRATWNLPQGPRDFPTVYSMLREVLNRFEVWPAT